MHILQSLTPCSSAAGNANPWVRALRMLRPLRFVRYSDGLRIVFDALHNCLPTVGAVLAVTMLVWLTFGLFGMGLFMGKFYSCTGGDGYEMLSMVECAKIGGQWVNPPYNFDNIVQSMRTLFICSTMEGWVDAMHSGMDVTSVGEAPVRNSSYGNFLYFWLFVILGSFFVTNLFIGVLVNFFKESTGSALMTQAQQQWMLTQRLARRTAPKRKKAMAKEGSPRHSLYMLVSNVWFDRIVGLIILGNVLLLSAEHFPQPEDFTDTADTINWLFLCFFTFEMVIKMIAYGPVEYIRDAFARMDVAIIGCCWISRVMSSFGAVQAFRAFRILRVMMLMKSSKVLRELSYTLVQSIFPALNLLFLMVMLIFMWAVLGMQVFGQLPHQEYINIHDNFDNIFNAMRFMFQISTGQDFMYLVQELEGHGSFTVHPFVFIFTFYVAVKWVVLNLLIAVLLENFENNFILDNMDLSQESIDEFGEVFATFTDDGVHDMLSSVQKASEFVLALGMAKGPKPWLGFLTVIRLCMVGLYEINSPFSPGQRTWETPWRALCTGSRTGRTDSSSSWTCWMGSTAGISWTSRPRRRRRCAAARSLCRTTGWYAG
jgi:hypothetical protein